MSEPIKRNVSVEEAMEKLSDPSFEGKIWTTRALLNILQSLSFEERPIGIRKVVDIAKAFQDDPEIDLRKSNLRLADLRGLSMEFCDLNGVAIRECQLQGLEIIPNNDAEMELCNGIRWEIAPRKMKDEQGSNPLTKDLTLLANELMELMGQHSEHMLQHSEHVSVLGSDLIGLIDNHSGRRAEDVLAE